MTVHGATREEAETPMEQLPAEIEDGNIEYKLKLVGVSESRLIHLTTQMQYRLAEGGGRAVYRVGVEDNGLVTGLSSVQLEETLGNLRLMAAKLGADIIHCERLKAATGRRWAEVVVERLSPQQQTQDIKVAVLGAADAGKSTLLGVLTQGELDNGRGEARLNLFRHLHEFQSGRTSSISLDVIGYDSDGRLVNYSTAADCEDICRVAHKLVTVIDLGGHPRYARTTIAGLVGYRPDFVIVVVSASAGVTAVTEEHLILASCLNIPIIVTVTKSDLSGNMPTKALTELEDVFKRLPQLERKLKLINDEKDAVAMASSFYKKESAVPVLAMSNVSGHHLDLLTTFIGAVGQPPAPTTIGTTDHTLFNITEVFEVADAGIVVAGHVSGGALQHQQSLVIGPDASGAFRPAHVQSLHWNRHPAAVVTCGQSATVALGDLEGTRVRKGMVLAAAALNPRAVREFEAVLEPVQVRRLACIGFEATLFLSGISQAVQIVGVSVNYATAAEPKPRVKLRFTSRAEFLSVGSNFLLRQTNFISLGRVTALY